MLNFYINLRLYLSTSSTVDVLALVTFYLAVTTCFALSAIFHTFSDHSAEAHKFGNELDHLGVVFVIWGSGIPSTHFGFYCDAKTQLAYNSLTTATAIAAAVFTLQPRFRTPAYRTSRFLMYCVLGSSLFIPAIHGVIVNGWSVQNERMSLQYFLGLGILNFGGAAIYAVRIPERWYPRSFDIWGSSHQIMHVLVVCGALSHLTGLLHALEFWNARGKMTGNACDGL